MNRQSIMSLWRSRPDPLGETGEGEGKRDEESAQR